MRLNNKQKITPTILITLLFISLSLFAQKRTIKVACIGNSVTYGFGLQHREQECYPAKLQALVGSNYDVRNFGHSGATLLKKGHNPYYKTQEFGGAISFAPDIAIIHLGLNDTDPRDWPAYHDDFEADYAWLIAQFRKANPAVKIYICRLTPIFSGHPRFKSGTRDWYWQIQNLIPEIARVNHTGLIDLHSPLYSRPNLFADNIHPDREGASILASTVSDAIIGYHGSLKIPGTFSDNMVLQRNKQIPISGRANTGDLLQVSFQQHKWTVTADMDGHWKVILPAMHAGGPFNLAIKDRDSVITIKNILIGDVWICSGQSNMAFPLNNEANGQSEIQKASDNKMIRLCNMEVLRQPDSVVWDTAALTKINRLGYFSGSWKTANALSAKDFSAIGYYFAKKISLSEHVPIGIVEIAVGGSPIDSWIDRYTMEHDPILVDMLNNWRKSDFLMKWCRDRADVNLKDATAFGQRHPYEPCYNYEAGIANLVSFPVSGVIWYQGESDADQPDLYRLLFKTMVGSWRQKWGYPLPFYFVQLSGINRPSWPAFRDMENKLQQQIPGVHMAVSMDMGDSLNVHYKRKAVVANRLALLALRYTYHEQITADGPAVVSEVQKSNTVIITFNNKLAIGDGKSLKGFELVNEKGERLPVSAAIKDNHVWLKIPQGEKIKTVFYGMQPYTHANLVNNSGLPASTFILPLHDNTKIE